MGAGPAGLYAAFYAALRGLSVRLLEARPEPGGQLAALYPDKKIYDVPAAPAAYAGEVVDRLLRQLGPFDIELRLNELALSLTPDGRGWRVGTLRGSYPAGAVILAAGMGALLPRAAPALPGVPTLSDWPPAPGSGSFLVAGARVWVQGGVPQATRAALELAEAGRQVTLSHRRALFRGTPAQLERLETLRRAGQIELHAPATADFAPAVPPELRVHLNGYLPDLSPLLGWPLGWQGEYLPADAGGQTCLPGVYVAGDLSRAGGDFKLIALAFAQAAITANHAAHHVRPDLSVKPGHSSDRRLPG